MMGADDYSQVSQSFLHLVVDSALGLIQQRVLNLPVQNDLSAFVIWAYRFRRHPCSMDFAMDFRLHPELTADRLRIPVGKIE